MSTGGIICTELLCRRRLNERWTRLGFLSGRPRIRFATVLPATCCRPIMISAQFRSYWGTAICEQQQLATAPQQCFQNKTFRITHPFHPLQTKEFEICSIKKPQGERRVYFYNSENHLVSVPLHWTDLEPPDPFVTISDGRAFFRVPDLLRLVRLLDDIKRGDCI